MNKTPFIIVLCFILICSTWGQPPELPMLPLEQPENPPINDILNDQGFMEIYGQMLTQRPDAWSLLPLQLPSQTATEAPASAPPVSVPLHNLPRPLLDIAVQQLVQLDGHKNVLLQNLRNAETCGFRAAVYESADANLQSDFQTRRYESSSKYFHWAIHGDGFFVLCKQREPSDTDESMPHDETDTYYTRAGRFELTDDHKLCLKRGGKTYLLQPEIEIPMLIGVYDFREGQLYITYSGGLQEKRIGEWQLARFDHTERLQRLDGVLFQMDTDGEKPEMFIPTEASDTTIRTREYEASNVDVAETWQVYRALHKMQTAIVDSAAF